MERPDTVSELRGVLGEEPSREDAEELLELEKEAGDTRKTAVSAIESYLEEYEGDYSRYRVTGDTPEFERGEVVEVVPEEYELYIQDGRLESV